MNLLNISKHNHKLKKSDASGEYFSAIMYLAPHKMSGTNICPNASKGCIASCLFLSGQGVYSSVIKARLNRTQVFLKERNLFLSLLYEEISTHYRRGSKNGKKCCIRLNGTSDIMWEKVFPSLFTDFPNVQFYDYTKNHHRMKRFLAGELPKNYHLTFSRSENNEDKCSEILSLGGTVAVVFNHKKELPKKFMGFKVVSGDETDLRFLDKKSTVIGLLAKGKAKRDRTGFVIQ